MARSDLARFRLVTTDSPVRPRPGLLELGWAMLRLGLISFGGNNALLMSRLVVDQRRWLTRDELDQGIALATMSPGGNSSNLSFEVGRRIRGLPGGLVSYAAMAVPGIVLVILVGTALLRHGDAGLVGGLLHGAQAGVVSMVLIVGLRLGRSSLRSPFDWALAAAAFVLVALVELPLALCVPPLALIGYAAGAARARRGAGR